jgi:hypothetical protein
VALGVHTRISNGQCVGHPCRRGSLRMYVCMYVYMYVCTYVRMYVYIYMCVCMYVYILYCSIRPVNLYIVMWEPQLVMTVIYVFFREAEFCVVSSLAISYCFVELQSSG